MMQPSASSKFASILALILVSGPVHAEAPATPVPTVFADGVGQALPDKFLFSLGRCTYVVQLSGLGERRCGRGPSSAFQVPLKTNEVVWIRLSFLSYEGDLILAHDIQNDPDDYGAGSLVRLDGSTLSAKWQIDMNPNTCPCLRQGRYLYVTGWAFLGMVDLDEGRYVWSHHGRDKGFPDIEAFETPQIQGSDVMFVGQEHGRSARVIHVNRMTGKLTIVK